jgi:hypothetical protein
MTTPSQPQFAIRLTGPDGVEKLYLATAFGTFATSATVPADATATLKASIAKIEAILGDKTVVMLGDEGSNPEGQMIEGQMIEGQMIDDRSSE